MRDGHPQSRIYRHCERAFRCRLGGQIPIGSKSEHPTTRNGLCVSPAHRNEIDDCRTSWRMRLTLLHRFFEGLASRPDNLDGRILFGIGKVMAGDVNRLFL